MVQETNRQEHPAELGVLLQSDVDSSLQLGSLKDEGAWHTDEAGNESGPGVDACAAQALDVAHCPASHPFYSLCIGLCNWQPQKYDWDI